MMGQGHYIGIVFGLVGPFGDDLDEDATEAIESAIYKVGRCSYESEVNWAGVPVADSGANAFDRRGIPGEPEIPALSYTALPLDGLAAWVDKNAAKRLAWARKQWEALRAKHPTLPEGRLVLVADYD
jgi:hypothetical protein